MNPYEPTSVNPVAIKPVAITRPIESTQPPPAWKHLVIGVSIPVALFFVMMVVAITIQIFVDVIS